MDDSEDIVKPRRSTRTTGTSGVAKDDGDAIAASDAHAPTKKKKKIVKRKVVKRKLIKSTSGTDDGGSDSSIASPRKKVVKKKIVKRKVTKSISTDSNDASSGDGDDNDDEVEEEASVGNISTKASPKKKRVAPKRAKSPAKKVKKAKVEPQRITEKDDLTKLWDSAEALERHGSYTFKILSWNVAGIRALLRKHPNALPDLASKHDIDVICLQETKLQEIHVEDPKLKLKGHVLEKEGYDSHWSCSTTKKGYSGTAVFIKRRTAEGGSADETKPKDKKQATLGAFFVNKNETDASSVNSNAESSNIGKIDVKHLIPDEVSCSMGAKEHDEEGRIITMDFPLFSLANLYVPNSGQKLERLSYRTEQWDTALLECMQQKEKEGANPVIWLGDLNVAHKAYDCWNDGAKHLAKQSGTTQEEKDSFQKQLDTDGGAYVDAFRHLYPDAKGHYTYWSQRAGNKAPNKGLRIDYFICSKTLFEDSEDKKVLVRDSYMIPEQEGSDHCPIVLELEIRK